MFFNPEKCRNETEVESKFIVQYLLPTLGYTPDSWNQEVSLGSIRLDFLIFASQIFPISLKDGSPICLVVEAKNPKQSLNPHIPKLKKYLTCLGIHHGLLTNGKEVRIFKRDSQEINLVFKCRGSEVNQRILEIQNLIGREELRTQKFTRRQDEQKEVDNRKNQGQQRINNLSLTSGTSKCSTSVATKKTTGLDQANALKLSSHSHKQLQTQARGQKMQVIAVYHNKGGVGKTTTVVNLAAALSKQGKRVLVIDLDSQANTTFAVGLVKFDDEVNDSLKEKNILHLLGSEEFFPIKEVAQTAEFCSPAIDVVPSHIDLMGAENDLNSLDYSRMILIQKLNEVQQNYDIVIIDTPPSLNLYARIALIAADFLIIPSDLKPFANQGLNNVKGLIRDINGFRKIIQKKPIDILGVLATKVSPNYKFKQSTLPKRIQTVIERYELDVMETVIFERDDLAKCSEVTTAVGDLEIPDPRSILDYKPESDSAREFKSLAEEVMRKIK